MKEVGGESLEKYQQLVSSTFMTYANACYQVFQ